MSTEKRSTEKRSSEASRLEVRRVVRTDLEQIAPGDLVLVACSGGADSLALASAVVLEAPTRALRVGVVTVDRGLQPGSAERAAAVVEQIRGHVDFAEVRTVAVGTAGGPEAAARAARYAALDRAAEESGAVAIYLGHTGGDQAENVLLGLARGSGARSLAGMATVSGRYRRPLLGLAREVVRQAGAENHFGISPWEDPQNIDARYLRSRVRHQLLPALEAELGPGIEEALSRSARLLREDADALDEIAASHFHLDRDRLDITSLTDASRAVRARVILAFVRSAGVPALTAEHVDRIDALISGWKGQGPVALPGGGKIRREGARLVIDSH